MNTIDVPQGLSNLLSAYDDAHWETVVAELKSSSGVLQRGSVLSAVAADGGKLTKTTAGSEATAYGILLDESVDTAAAFSDGSVTCSVARAGSFRGAALIVGTGTNGVTLADRLRDVGIYTHGAIPVPAQVNVRLSVNFIGASGRLWKAGEELPEEIVPETAARYILGSTGSSADPEDVPAAVVSAKNRGAKVKAQKVLPERPFEG